MRLFNRVCSIVLTGCMSMSAMMSVAASETEYANVQTEQEVQETQESESETVQEESESILEEISETVSQQENESELQQVSETVLENEQEQLVTESQTEVSYEQETEPIYDAGYTGLVNCGGNVWQYQSNGVTQWNYTGLTKYYGTWYYVEKGVLNWKYTGLTNYYGTWYYVENGVLNWKYNGLTKYYGTWYYVENGVLNWNYTGLTNYYGTWYYVEKGVLNWKFTELTNYYGTWYYVENGVLNWKYTGLFKHAGGWYYIENGVLNWNYTGFVEYYGTWYYVQKGFLHWNYTGAATSGKTVYYVKNGVRVGLMTTGVKLDKNSVTLENGQSTKITASALPSNAYNRDIIWSSSDSSVAAVNNGTITAKKVGSAVITAKTALGGYTATCQVTVYDPEIAVSSISITNDAKVAMDCSYPDSHHVVSYSISPSNATNKNVSWSSENTSVATVDSNGVVTAHGAGTTTITVTTANGKSASMLVYVYQSGASFPTGLKRIRLTGTNCSLDVNGGNAFNGVNVQVYRSNDSKAQAWAAHDYRNQYGGYAMCAPNGEGPYVLDIYRGNSAASAGQNVDMWQFNDHSVQLWIAYKMWDGTYRIVLKGTSLTLTAAGTESGSNVYVADFDLWGTNQNWVFEDITVVTPTVSHVTDGEMTNVVSVMGKQTDKKYNNYSIMCSVYCMGYVRYYLYGDRSAPTTYWLNNVGANWAKHGGTSRNPSDVLAVARQYIDKKKPVIIHVNWAPYGTHYVVAYAYTGSGTSLSDFKIVDPWAGTLKRLNAFSLYGDNQIITFE